MDFAKKELEKYGWKEGEGLGRNKSGISKAIKPKLKSDTGGLGHDAFDDLRNTWWQRLYDEAASNIVTKKGEDDSVVLDTVGSSVEISTKSNYKKHIKSPEMIYKNFVKTSELKHNVEKKILDVSDEEPEVKKKKMTSGICDLTDEELFNVCGGRTAHKGARHGLKMNAKLARLEKQENSLNCETELVKKTVKNVIKKRKNESKIS